MQNRKDKTTLSVKSEKANVIGKLWKVFIMCATVYVGVLMCVVPSVLCYSDQLTYEKIYNETKYPQLHHRPRTYDIFPERNKNSSSIELKTVAEEEYNIINNLDRYSFENKKPNRNDNSLLVGFSHDPYRNSMLESEFISGVSSTRPEGVNSKGERDKRGVVHLYNMINCATGCDPITYKGYGCYCGFLGAGRSMDGIDRCCKIHDQCYENIYCPLFTVYFQPYYWKCYHGQPLCARENYETRNQLINGCAAKLCECDRRFAMCLQRYRCPRRRALCTSSPIRLLQNVIMFP